MSIVKPPITEPRDADQPADEVDRVLFQYFRKEMRQPWPELELPADTLPSTVEPVTARRPLIRSRWALAASIALLLLGHWLLAGKSWTGGTSKPSHGMNVGQRETLSTQPNRR